MRLKIAHFGRVVWPVGTVFGLPHSIELWVTGLVQRPPSVWRRQPAYPQRTAVTRCRFAWRSQRGTLAASVQACLQQVLMILHPVGVPADVDDMAVVHQPVDEGRCHDFVAEQAAPVLEALGFANRTARRTVIDKPKLCEFELPQMRYLQLPPTTPPCRRPGLRERCTSAPLPKIVEMGYDSMTGTRSRCYSAWSAIATVVK